MLLPLNVDVPMSRLPIANWVLMGMITCATVVGWSNRRAYYWMAGMERVHPAQAPGGANPAKDIFNRIHEAVNDALGRGWVFNPPAWKLPIIALTSSLVHADALHLLGNLLFLWLFGNAVNYKLGHSAFLALYAAGAVFGGLAIYCTGVPCVGASGPIMCMAGAFLVFFPSNDITVVASPSAELIWPAAFQLSSWMAILLWVGLDVLFLVLGVQDGIGYGAHVAGFAVGFSVAAILAATRIIRPTPYEHTLLQVFGFGQAQQ
jgi:membrane associated rhomboid family serine protease